VDVKLSHSELGAKTKVFAHQVLEEHLDPWETKSRACSQNNLMTKLINCPFPCSIMVIKRSVGTLGRTEGFEKW
jgi:hypothetical protein